MLNDRAIFWIDEELRLRKRICEVEAALRSLRVQLIDAEQRTAHAKENEKARRVPPRSLPAAPAIHQDVLAVASMGLRPDQISETLSLIEYQGRGPRCRLCGFADDEVGGGKNHLFGVCDLCRGIFGQDFAKPRALIEARLEELNQPLLVELASADAWSEALGQPVGIGQKVDAIKFLGRASS